MKDECAKCNYRHWDKRAKRPWCLLSQKYLIGHGKPVDCPLDEYNRKWKKLMEAGEKR